MKNDIRSASELFYFQYVFSLVIISCANYKKNSLIDSDTLFHGFNLHFRMQFKPR